MEPALHRSSSSLTRRRFGGTLAAMVALTAGCLGDDSADVMPVSLDGERACDQCGMMIEDHPGTVGQVHFADDDPEGGRPAQFCSATCCYTYRFDAEAGGRDPVETFLTDYSSVDYEAYQEGDDTMLSSHVAADAFGREPDLTVVADSDVVGAMGPDLVPFGDSDDAEAFAAEHGGQTLDAVDVDRALVDSL